MVFLVSKKASIKRISAMIFFNKATDFCHIFDLKVIILQLASFSLVYNTLFTKKLKKV